MHPSDDDIGDIILYQLNLTMNKFYDCVKVKPTEVLVRYERILKPKNYLDILCYYLNENRSLRHGEVQRVLEDKKKYSK